MDTLLAPELLVAALALSAVYALVALGLNLIYGAMRLLDVAHGEVMMLGAYVSYWAFTSHGIGPLRSMFGAMAAAAAIGWLVYVTTFRRLMRTPALVKRLEANSLLIFFGLSVILQNVGALAFGPDARSYVYLDDLVTIGNVTLAMNRLVLLAVGIVACLAALLFFRLSPLGLAIRALIQSRDAAALVGIDTEQANRAVFCIGFALAGLAGSMISMTETFTPFSGFPFTVAAFVVVILGGLGSLSGGLVGAAVLAFVEVYGSSLTSTAYRSILVYGVFVAVLFLRPQGLLGRRMA